MSGSRLSLALDQGLVAFGDGPVVVWGARAETDLAGVPEGAEFIVTFRPDHDALRAAGRTVGTTPPGTANSGIVFLPREKALARAMVAEAARISAGPVVVDGQKTDGIEGLLRDLRTRGTLSEAISKAHGKLAVLAPGADLADWTDPGMRDAGEGFVTRAGVFSADGPDPGSQLLAEALPARLGPRVADLGAGWGYLSRAALAREGVTDLHLVEADLRALDCARINVADPRATFHWADALTFRDDVGFDSIVMNPPFHTTRAGDPALGQSFIASAARNLKPQGQVWLVANRHLPYEKGLGALFREVSEVGGDRSYKLFRAARPLKQGARA